VIFHLIAASVHSAEMPVSFADVLALDATPPTEVLRYGTAESNTAALWLPSGQGVYPVLVLIHGGCWLEEYTAPYIYPLAARLAEDGYAVYVPEYRRVGEAGGGWPGTAADLVRALDHLAGLRHPRLSLERTVLAGHSAGGHLGLWLASRDAALFRSPLKVVAALGIAAITDLDAYARGSNSCEIVTRAFMGGMPEEVPDRYAAASPARLSRQVPVLLLRGAEDPIVSAAQARALQSASVRELPGAGHFDWVHPDTAAYPALRDALFTLLSSAVSGSPP
jgi:acetyl esterase/lipase